MGQWDVHMLRHGSNCLLVQATDGCIMRCGIISSCQSAATYQIVKCSWTCVIMQAAQVPVVQDLHLFAQVKIYFLHC